MPTEKKVALVAELEERIARASIAIGLDYRGLTVTQLQHLRRALREHEANMELRVVKNSLWKRAAENAGKAEAGEVVQEATAILFGYEEPVTPPKALRTFTRENRLDIPIYAAYMDGQLLSADAVADLATVPTRLELMAKLAGGLNSPVAGIALSLQDLLRRLAAVTAARADQLEAASAD